MPRASLLPTSAKFCLLVGTLLWLAVSAGGARGQTTLTFAPAVPRAAPAVPQPLPPIALTLAEAERIALVNHPGISRAQAEIEATEGRWLQVGLQPNPRLIYMGDDIGELGGAGKHGAFIGRKIITGGKLRLRRAVVEQEITQAQQRFWMMRYRIIGDVRIAFYVTAAAQTRVALAQQLVDIGTKGVESAQKLRKARLVSDVDVLKAQIETDEAGITLYNAKVRHVAAWRRLTAVLGRPTMRPVELSNTSNVEPKNYDWNVALARLETDGPQMAAALAKLEQARWQVQLACAEASPDLNAQAGVQYDFTGRETLVGVQISVPLRWNDRNQGGIEQAEAELRAAQSEIERLALGLRHQLAEVFGQYADARMEAQKYTQDILPRAKRALELVTKGYEATELAYVDLLDAQRTYFRSSLRQLEATERLRRAAAELDNFLLSGSLDERP